MAKSASEIVIDSKLCKGCHICIALCPQSVLVKSEEVDNRGFFLPEVANLDACTVCRICELECPDFAISVIEQK
jgi:2-oxoglutarate ferredoxin oxidoreductase subunit delta